MELDLSVNHKNERHGITVPDLKIHGRKFKEMKNCNRLTPWSRELLIQ